MAHSSHPRSPVIGVLALQGDYASHAQALEDIGTAPKMVRTKEDLAQVDGLIIPGGESTTFLKLLEREGLFQPLLDFCESRPTFGTCAGCILLATKVVHPEQQSLGVLHATVQRNGYGRQIDSDIVSEATSLPGGPLEMVFIRAPRIEKIDESVDVLAQRNGDPVLVRQKNILAATFHPELSHSSDRRVHRYFLRMVEDAMAGASSPRAYSGCFGARAMILPAAGAFALAAMSEIATRMPWLPTAASLHASAIDRLMGTSLIVLLALCVVAQILILFGLILRRKQAARISGPWRWGAIAAVVVFFVWMTVVSEHLWSVVRLTSTRPDALRVEVTGVQFQWYFRYPGTDGVFGRTQPGLIDAAGGNPLGVDPNDPRDADDVVSSVLVLPVDRQVDLTLRAQDVVHGFFIPSMRVMQNATPGSESAIKLTPTRLGDYPIVCSQLCGLGHYRMRAVLRVVSDQQYASWLKNREAQLAER